MAGIGGGSGGLAGSVAYVLVERRGGSQRLTGGVIDELRIDMAARTMHRHTRTPGGALAEGGADALTALLERGKMCHGLLLLAFFAERSEEHTLNSSH